MTEENKLKQCFRINYKYIKKVTTIPDKFFLVSPELPLTIGNSVGHGKQPETALQIWVYTISNRRIHIQYT
jgi:hypothetical protein